MERKRNISTGKCLDEKNATKKHQKWWIKKFFYVHVEGSDDDKNKNKMKKIR